jgi:hypothetical protein
MSLIPLPEPKYIGRLSNHEMMFGLPIPAIDRLKIFSPEQFEDLIREWSIGFLMKRKDYVECKKASGGGDKGRDIIGIIDQATGKWDNFQCKHYDHVLSPSDIYIEIGKILYYTFIKDYTVPRFYYFITALGVGPKLNEWIENPEKLKAELILNWDAYCKRKLLSTEVLLISDFKIYVENFDFSIFKGYDPQQIIDEHQTTPYYSARFGGGLQSKKRPITTVPSSIHLQELVYTTKLLMAYSDYKKTSISHITDLKGDAELIEHFNRQRESFYSADSLNQFSRDSFSPDYDYFKDLKGQFFRGIIDIVTDVHGNGYQKVKATTNFAKTLQIGQNPLSNELIMEDREGICHHLANEEEQITWVKK